MVSDFGELRECVSCLNTLWAKIACKFELEVARAIGTELQRPGLRAGAIQLQHERILKHGKYGRAAGAAEDVSSGWKWCETTLTLLQHRLQTCFSHDELENCLSAESQLVASALEGACPGRGLSARLDEAAEAVVDVASRVAHLVPSWAGEEVIAEEELQMHIDIATVAIADVLEHFESDFKVAAAKEAREDYENWQSFVDADLAKGARIMHRISKVPYKWRPALSRTVAGTSATDAAILQDEASKLQKLWDMQPSRSLHVPDRDALRRVSNAELTAASMSFSKVTCLSVDDFHMRHYAMLSEDGKLAFCILLEIIEKLGTFPSRHFVLVFSLIDKIDQERWEQVGVRPILTQTSLVRLWEALRRPYADEFMANTERPFWAFGAKKAAEEAVYHFAVEAEYLHAYNCERLNGCEQRLANEQHFGGCLVDGRKFYEQFPLITMFSRMHQHGFPSVLCKVLFNQWSAERWLRLGRKLVRVQGSANNGMPAGSKFSDMCVRGHCVDAFDSFALRCPCASLKSYIDDNLVKVVGNKAEVCSLLPKAMQEFHSTMVDDLQASLRYDKLCCATSASDMTKTLKRRLGIFARTIDIVLVWLGIDFSTKPSRRTKLQRKRLRYCRLQPRARRIHEIAKRLRKPWRLKRLLHTGAKPATVYGESVVSNSPRQLRQLRTAVSCLDTPASRGVSLDQRMALLGDSCWKSAVPTTLMFAKQLWISFTEPARSLTSLGTMLEWWQECTDHCLRKAKTTGSFRFDRCSGPIAKMHWELAQIGWQARTPFEWQTHNGTEISLKTTSPMMLSRFLKIAVHRVHEIAATERILRQFHSGSRTHRLSFTHAARIVGSGSTFKHLTTLEKYLVRAAICDAVWTEDKCQKRGYVTDGSCPLCGQPDSLFHRIWQCMHSTVAAARRLHSDVFLVEEAVRHRDSDEAFFLCTGLFEHPVAYYPRPAPSGGLVVFGPHGQLWPEGVIEQVCTNEVAHVVTDGSACVSVFPELSRAAWAATFLNGNLQIIGTVAGPVWEHLAQDSNIAETVGTLFPADGLDPGQEWTLHCDCLPVVKQWSQPHNLRILGDVLNAGNWIAAPARQGFATCNGAYHVRAHQSQAAMQLLSEAERAIAEANHRSDHCANWARMNCHPLPIEDRLKDFEFLLQRSKRVMRVVGATLACFPVHCTWEKTHAFSTKQLQRMPRCRALQHSWHQCGNGWVCRRCLATTRALPPEELDLEGCTASSVPKGLAHIIDIASELGHKLALCTSKEHKSRPFRGCPLKEETALVACFKCGSWSSGQQVKLAHRCQQPTPVGRQVLRNLARGRHPAGIGSLSVAPVHASFLSRVRRIVCEADAARYPEEQWGSEEFGVAAWHASAYDDDCVDFV